MIDLVLVSKEAQRHVIYNTEFKSYWKLFIILVLLETYGLWRNDSLFNIVVNTICGFEQNNGTSAASLTLRDTGLACAAWSPHVRARDDDLFIWEKDFYIQFISTFAGIVVFIATMHSSMSILKAFTYQNEVLFRSVLKSFSLSYASVVLTLSMLVWGATDAPPHTRALHYALVAGYSLVVFTSVFTVLYECGWVSTGVVLVASHVAKYWTTFHVTSALRGLLV